MKLVIDVDTGMDDAQALMLALRSPEVEVLAVTCVGGNVPLDCVVRNTRLVVAAATADGRRPRPRVFAGCRQPLVACGTEEEIRATRYHGNDGMGGAWERLDASMTAAAAESVLVEPQHASLALVELAAQHKGELTLLTLAPLTNVAVALRLEPRLGSWLKGLVVMGGAYHSLGNTERHLSAEFNFEHDPEAARLVLLELLPCPRVLVPYEVCLSGGLPFDWACGWVGAGRKGDDLWRQLNRSIVSHQCSLQDAQASGVPCATTVGPLSYRSCDLLAACLCIRPALIAQSFSKHCTVELAGLTTRGQLVVDWFNKIGRGLSRVEAAGVSFVTEVDTDAYRAMLEELLG